MFGIRKSAQTPFPFPIPTREETISNLSSLTLSSYFSNKFHLPHFTAGETGLIYHYSDANALINILNTGELWATQSDFLNDSTEGTYALSRALEIIKPQLSDLGHGHFVAEIVHRRESQSKSDTFVVSFCRHGDLLSQWRGYGNFGAGYAIGLDVSLLTPPVQVGFLIRVIYDDEMIDEVCAEVSSIFSDIILSDRYPLDYVADELLFYLSFALQGFKHPSFKEENEYRLVIRRIREHNPRPYEAPVSFRCRANNIVPFIKTKLDFHNSEVSRKLPIREIVMGPGVSSANGDSITRLLRSHGYNEATVAHSLIPFSN